MLYNQLPEAPFFGALAGGHTLTYMDSMQGCWPYIVLEDPEGLVHTL